ncbi:MAG TPA: hypothetical protein VGH87_06370, partial [Polyangiaceae bacterium]
MMTKWVWVFVVACSHSPTLTPTPRTSEADASAPADVSVVQDAAPEAAAPVHPERAFALPPSSDCHDDIRCLVEHAYAADEKSKALALELFDVSGGVAGMDHDALMDGGFRGALHITPALPTGDTRVQLERVVAAARDFEAFFAKDKVDPDKYRWRDLTFRFFRSWSGPREHEVERTTPSAYAMGPRPMPKTINVDISFSLAYNLKGSMLTSEAGVREKIFHEVFHMNDGAHGDWSPRALHADYDTIVKKCGAMNVACLTPYAPNDTMVRGGTFYAFEPQNGLPV